MEEILNKLKKDFNRAADEVSKVIVGQKDVIKLINTAILARGHTLITGAPGLAKTLAVKAIARVLGIENSRIQFTPDLLPGDIVGVEILDIDDSGKKSFRYIKGPIFTNVLLADEINRTTPRTQSALLEAMQEKNVTLGGELYELDEPFIVFATRNPIDYEGVYPLPEAQLDRFIMEIIVDYPDIEDEIIIASKDHSKAIDEVDRMILKDDLLKYQSLVDDVPVPESVMSNAVSLVRKTRPDDPSSPSEVREFLEWGAGPRATYHLIHASRAYSLLYGNGVVTEGDIKAVFANVMRHRIIPSAIFNRTGRDIDELISKITTNK
ncbi:MAG: MoxR family ATPase [Spirochaetota bacterium]|nr:MoxR family ATPase [Spirochaetota bacterium]